MKKEWQKPQLVILTRGKPEEAVLTVCKIWASGGPASTEHCNWGATACWDIGSSYPLIPFGGVYPERSQRVQDRLLGFGPWESVKDASADSAQAADFTDPVAVCKGYELPSTGSGQASGS